MRVPEPTRGLAHNSLRRWTVFCALNRPLVGYVVVAPSFLTLASTLSRTRCQIFYVRCLIYLICPTCEIIASRTYLVGQLSGLKGERKGRDSTSVSTLGSPRQS